MSSYKIDLCLPVCWGFIIYFGLNFVLYILPFFYFLLNPNHTELRCRDFLMQMVYLGITGINLWNRSWPEIFPGACLPDNDHFAPYSYDPSSKPATIFVREHKIFSLKQV